MTEERKNRPTVFISEPAKRVPVVYDVDVVVAGAGVSGLFAALAAARQGAETVLIDRFGTVGGNMGPGVILGGGLFEQFVLGSNGRSLATDYIASEFIREVGELGVDAATEGGSESCFPKCSQVASYVGLKMLQEAGVKLMLSAYVADPIVEDGRVCGVFAENKSGRQAVKAKVVIDDTGDASLAARAGIPIIRDVPANPDWAPIITRMADTPTWNELGVWCAVGDVDWKKYDQFIQGFQTLSESDRRWAEEHREAPGLPEHLIPLYRQAWEAGDCVSPTISELGNLKMSFGSWGESTDDRLVGGRCQTGGAIDSGNAEHMSLIEAKLRMFVFEAVQFLHKYVPGFEKAYLLHMSPFLGGRGGPCIEGEYTLQIEDLLECGKRFDDVTYILWYETKKRDPKECTADIPYRILLSKIDGLMATGRSAAYIRRGHDPAVRARHSVITMGHVAGTAAALAARSGVAPRDLNVKSLQRQLLKNGCYLGDTDRLSELGL